MFNRLLRIVNNNYATHFFLFVLTFSFFAIHFGQVMFAPNQVLSVFSGDGIHGYYSYVNHICNNSKLIETTGLNFPYGEHIVYTDAQPVLATLISCLPLLKPYAIGVMHLVIFLSFVLVSNVYFKLFTLYKVNRFLAFCSSFAIAILSPQIDRLGGHFALAYSLPIPLCIYFMLAFYKSNKQKYIYFSLITSLLSFFTHPYLGLGTTIFSLFFFLISVIWPINQLKRVNFVNALILLLPVVLFKGLMKITDSHFQRPVIPFGETVYVSSPEVVFIPHFGPFKNLLKELNPLKPEQWEGVSYIGIISNVLILVAFILLLIRFSKSDRSMIFLAVVATVLLIFSFGIINDLLNYCDIQPQALKQFRGLGRFAWYFYYCMPVFAIVIIDGFLKTLTNIRIQLTVTFVAGLVYLLFNSFEGYYYLKNVSEPLFKDKNYFLKQNLTNHQTQIVNIALAKNYQAILPLPYFHLGSEVYHRPLKEIASLAMLLSFHTKLPILAHLGSRTSLYETEKSIGVLNAYRIKPELTGLFSEKPILIIKQGDLMKPEEERLIKKSKLLATISGCDLYEINSKDLLQPQTSPGRNAVNLTNDTITNTIYKIARSAKPFYHWYKCYDYNKLLILDSHQIKSGDYIVSFRYHFKKYDVENISACFIVEAKAGNQTNWDFFGDIHFSQKYPTFFVFEQRLKLLEHKNYVFFINHGTSKGDYYITDFCLRPDTMEYYEKRNGKIIQINNYPIGY